MISNWVKSILKTAALQDRVRFLSSNYAKKIMERLQKDYSGYANPQSIEKVIQLLSQADPTREGAENQDKGKYKYLEWLTRMFIGGDLRMSKDLSSFEDVGKASDAAGTHYANRHSLGSIMDYKDTSELLKLSNKPLSEFEQARQVQKARSKGAEVEYDDGHTRVLKVEYDGPAKTYSDDLLTSDANLNSSAQAVSTLGEGTSWCTKSKEVAAKYLVQGPFYLIYEDGEKVAQLHPASKQLMDTQDSPITFRVTDDDDGDDSYSTTKLATNTEQWISQKLTSLGAPGIVMNAQLEGRQLNSTEAKLVAQDPEQVLEYMNEYPILADDPKWQKWAKGAMRSPNEAARYLERIDGTDSDMMEKMSQNPLAIVDYAKNNFGVGYTLDSKRLSAFKAFIKANPKVQSEINKSLQATSDMAAVMGLTQVIGKDNPKAREALKKANRSTIMNYVETMNVFDDDIIDSAMRADPIDLGWIANVAFNAGQTLPREIEEKVLENAKERGNSAIVSNYIVATGHPLEKNWSHYDRAMTSNSIYSDPMEAGSVNHRGFFTGTQKRNPQAETWLQTNYVTTKHGQDNLDWTQKMWEKYLSSINTPWPEGLAKYLEIAKKNQQNHSQFSNLFDPAHFQNAPKPGSQGKSPYSHKHPMMRLEKTPQEHRMVPSPDGNGHIDPLTGQPVNRAAAFVRRFIRKS